MFHMMRNSVLGIFKDFTAYDDPTILSTVLLVAVMAIIRLRKGNVMMHIGLG